MLLAPKDTAHRPAVATMSYEPPRDYRSDDPEDVERALPLLGMRGALDQAQPCVLPGHAGDGTVTRRTGRYRCACLRIELTLAEAYASIRHGELKRPNGLLRVLWWQRVWVDAGLATYNLPAVTIEPGAAADLMRGMVLLRAIFADDPRTRHLPSDYSQEFAAAWCGLPTTTVRRHLQALVGQEFLLAERVTNAGRTKRRYRLSGKGLDLRHPDHLDLVSLAHLTPEALPA